MSKIDTALPSANDHLIDTALAGEGDSPLPKEQESRGKKLLSKGFALLLSASIILLIFSKIDLKELLVAISRIGFLSGVSLAAVFCLSQMVAAFKWRLLLANCGVERTIAQVIRAYFAGMFVNSFGLGTVGGDVIRALAVKPASGQRTATMASVAADRVHGLAVLLAIGILAASFSQSFLGQYETRLFGSSVLVVTVLAWWFGPRVLLLLCKGEGRIVRSLRMSANAFPDQPKLLLVTTAIALLSHSLQISIHIGIAVSLGIELPLLYYFAIVPVVNIISCLPISVQGLGVREGLYLLILTPLGVQPELAVALGITWVLVGTAVSVLGGFLLSSPVAHWLMQRPVRQ